MAKSNHDSLKLRSALQAVIDWVMDPENTPRPSRPLLADAVRRSVRALEHDAPGHTVEVRVPPFVAVQCIEGPKHTRGTPPNIVEMEPLTWLRVAVGAEEFEGNPKIDASGTRAHEVATWLPIVAYPNLKKPS